MDTFKELRISLLIHLQSDVPPTGECSIKYYLM